MKNNIVKTRNIQIDANIDNKILDLTISLLNQGICQKRFTAQIAQDQILDSFENFAELQNHLSVSEHNYEVRASQKTLLIKGETSIGNRKTLVNLLTIQLKQGQVKPANVFQFILMKCKKQGDLTNEELKQMFKHIGFHLKKEEQKKMWKRTETPEEFKMKDEFSQSLFSEISRNTQKLDNMAKTVTEKLEEFDKKKNVEITKLFERMDKREGTLDKKLEQGLGKLSQETKKLQNEVAKIEGSFHQFICEITENVSKNQKRFDKNISDMQSGIQKLSQKVEEISIIQSQFAHVDDLKQIQLKVKSLIQEQKKVESKKDKIEQIMNFPPSQKKLYSIAGLQIRKISDGSFHNSGVIANLPISKKSEFNFKVIKTENYGVSVGIKQSKSNQFIKFGGNGWIINCGSMIYGQGRGLASGDRVKVSVDISKKLILWEVENKQINYSYQTKCQNIKIGLKQKQWFPFITIMQNDVIEIIN